MIILILKFIALVFMALASIIAIKNYMLTKFASGIWGLISISFLTGTILLFVRFIKEFIPLVELEVVKICLLPVMMAFIFAASFELERNILKPV
ncbi:MAG: hypothetical protein QFX38_04560 [Methanothermobacter sp.]|nr:hypothetical protein [Methanothermobacter sp.]